MSCLFNSNDELLDVQRRRYYLYSMQSGERTSYLDNVSSMCHDHTELCNVQHNLKRMLDVQCRLSPGKRNDLFSLLNDQPMRDVLSNI